MAVGVDVVRLGMNPESGDPLLDHHRIGLDGRLSAVGHVLGDELVIPLHSLGPVVFAEVDAPAPGINVRLAGAFVNAKPRDFKGD